MELDLAIGQFVAHFWLIDIDCHAIHVYIISSDLLIQFELGRWIGKRLREEN